jgi:hypothetical protein
MSSIVETMLEKMESRYEFKHPRRGRSLDYEYPMENIQTRVPRAVRKYLRILAAARGQSQAVMFDEMMRLFLEERPWEYQAEFVFLKPKIKRTLAQGGADDEDLYWCLLNINMRYDTAIRVKETVDNLGVSLASFAFTAIHWWIREKNPPKVLRALL